MNPKKLLTKPILLFIVCCLLFVSHTTFAKALKYQDYPEELFDEESCKEDIFFKKEGPTLIREMNKKFDDRLEEIFKDNIAHPTHTVKMIVKDIRTYNSQFNQLCSRVETNCSGGFKKNNFLSQHTWCKTKQLEFLTLQKTKAKYFITANTARKQRSLYEEKLSKIGHQFYKYIHISNMKDLLEAIKLTQKMVEYLAAYPDFN